MVNWDTFNPAHLSSTQNTITREYDALSRIRKVEYPQGRAGQRKAMIAKYNKGGALLSLKVGSTVFGREMAYNARGQHIFPAMRHGNHGKI